ncbi:hypothetical protein ThimaDRAFT_1671 [Thiocapsa marina 5811]|uniref:Uncharacterized protein n=1 Tax=Thiocapsa marina 5811 TaxID=768671 RepID=F9U9R9_9GAMM|nr:hypothetical protein ThimaDRAFT_1671 [Thiocapsa marina 5811]
MPAARIAPNTAMVFGLLTVVTSMNRQKALGPKHSELGCFAARQVYCGAGTSLDPDPTTQPPVSRLAQSAEHPRYRKRHAFP